MPLDTFKTRLPDNVPGKFYVTDQCLDCDLCREIAPANFARKDWGVSYVFKQPETLEEENLVGEAVTGCCTSAIHTDGDIFDWQSVKAEGFIPSGIPVNSPGFLTRLWRWLTGTARDE